MRREKHLQHFKAEEKPELPVDDASVLVESCPARDESLEASAQLEGAEEIGRAHRARFDANVDAAPGLPDPRKEVEEKSPKGYRLYGEWYPAGDGNHGWHAVVCAQMNENAPREQETGFGPFLAPLAAGKRDSARASRFEVGRSEVEASAAVSVASRCLQRGFTAGLYLENHLLRSSSSTELGGLLPTVQRAK